MAKLSQLKVGDKIIFRGVITQIDSGLAYPLIVKSEMSSESNAFRASELELDKPKPERKRKK